MSTRNRRNITELNDNLLSGSFTDMGNAERFITFLQDRAKYSDKLGWMYWNSNKWMQNANTQVEMEAQKMVRQLKELSKQNEHFSKDIYKLESAHKLAAMIKLAKPHLHISEEIFDTDVT